MASNWLPTIDQHICTGCEACVLLCPTAALDQVAGKAWLVRPSACIYCNLCEDICPVDAISLPFLILFAPSADGDLNLEEHS